MGDLRYLKARETSSSGPDEAWGLGTGELEFETVIEKQSPQQVSCRRAIRSPGYDCRTGHIFFSKKR